MKTFFTLLYKELVQFLRNKGLLAFVIYAFSLDIYFAATGIDLSLKNGRFYVEDRDLSKTSRELICKFQPPTFNFQGYINDESQIEELLMENKALGVIRIPENFERDFERGRAKVAVIVNGAEIASNYLFAGYSEQIIRNFAISKISSLKEFPLVEARERVFFNPNGESRYFMGISELLTVITLFLIILPAAAIIREKERGNIEMIAVSPVPNYVFMLAKVVLMGLVILSITFLSIMLMIKGILNIPVKGNIFTFLMLTGIYVFTTSGLSMFIASVSENMLQVSQLSILALMPILYLSGSWTPIESMPEPLQYLSALSPLKYYMDGAFGIVLKGYSLKDLSTDMALLFTLGFLVFSAGSYFLSRRA